MAQPLSRPSDRKRTSTASPLDDALISEAPRALKGIQSLRSAAYTTGATRGSSLEKCSYM